MKKINPEKLENLLNQFRSLETVRDVAEVLEIQFNSLIYFVRVMPKERRYHEFDIRKRNGSSRKICAPVPGLKKIQRQLNFILQNYISPKVCAHGFIYERSIKTNSKIHCNRNLVFNVDLKDFFPTIHFGRVRGLFKAPPFNFNDDVSTILAQICCNDYLPQGAPTSPVVTNFICSKMDGQLLKLAKQHRCFYTRYADDITFSTNYDEFPVELVKQSADGSHVVGDAVNEIIIENGFEVNEDKTRLREKIQSQIVTGLVVNKFPNVRRRFVADTRGMIHSWYKYGHDGAQAEFYSRFNYKHRNPESGMPKYKEVVAGRVEFIGMIKGNDNAVYQKLCRKLSKLYPERKLNVKYDNSKLPLLITEGGSDRIHFKAALRNLQKLGLYHYLDVEFSEYQESMGEKELEKTCRLMARNPQSRKMIYIFDSDNQTTVGNVNNRNGNPRYWGNNVYSFSLPVPSHRRTTPNISIEFYYSDEELSRLDSNGRRLFMNKEFDFNSRQRKHLTEELWFKRNVNDIRRPNLFVLDDEVVDLYGVNVALPKAKFAQNVLNQMENFNDFDFTEFKKVFNLIESINKKNLK